MLRIISTMHKNTEIFDIFSNSALLVFIGKLLLRIIRWVSFCQVFTDFSAFSHHLSLTKLATSSTRVKLNLSTPVSQYMFITHSHLERPKQTWQFWWYFSYKSIFWKIFGGKILIRSQATTLLQIFCELLFYSQVISKSMKVADDTF